MPIRSSMVRQSVGKVWFRFLACVAMAGGLCWQLGAAPVQAQSLAEEPPTWTGEFLSQGELYQGNYTLRRTGPTISIMISATRTQMQGQGSGNPRSFSRSRWHSGRQGQCSGKGQQGQSVQTVLPSGRCPADSVSK